YCFSPCSLLPDDQCRTHGYENLSTTQPIIYSATGRIFVMQCNETIPVFLSSGLFITVTFEPCNPPLVAPCGGSLYGSGTFHSPNYPDYYQDNSYCVWQLRTADDQRIFLQFTFLQLENCCSCDYITIFDGPSVNSQYLGRVCNSNSSNSVNSFSSTSNYMTVLFRSDGSVVARGFTAEFISALPPNSGRVDCSSDNMNIVIERAYLNSLGYDGHSLYLDDQYCRPQVSTYQVVFSFPINTCGTVRKFDNGRIVYTNTIRAYTSSSGEITRQSHFRMNVGCRMEQDSVSQIIYLVSHPDNGTIVGTGRFNTSMAFYKTSNFHYQVFPYNVKLNQNLFVQVNLRRGDSTLVLFIDTYDEWCKITTDICSVDNTYYAYMSGTQPYARFTFKAFQFLRATEFVYIQCKVLICPASDYNSRCRRGCNKRVARDLGSNHDSQTLVLGPIQLKAASFIITNQYTSFHSLHCVLPISVFIAICVCVFHWGTLKHFNEPIIIPLFFSSLTYKGKKRPTKDKEQLS
uniref:Uncharacterized protein n=1 Tax=Anabas testudineus TaxID=64144 RepID=A0A3Q1J8R1_ANATE